MPWLFNVVVALVAATAVALTWFPFSRSKRPRQALPIVTAVGVGVYLLLWYVSLKLFHWEDLFKIVLAGCILGLGLNWWARLSYVPALWVFAPLLALSIFMFLGDLRCFMEWTSPSLRTLHIVNCRERQIFGFQHIGVFGIGIAACMLVTWLLRKRWGKSAAPGK